MSDVHNMIQCLHLPLAFCRFRSQHEVDAFLHKNQITMKGRDIPLPVVHFQEAAFPDPVINTIRKSGFENPTSIQSVGWPIALSGRDMVGIAQTGSGKTLAVSEAHYWPRPSLILCTMYCIDL